MAAIGADLLTLTIAERGIYTARMDTFHVYIALNNGSAVCIYERCDCCIQGCGGQEHWSTGEDYYDSLYSLYSMYQVLLQYMYIWCVLPKGASCPK